MWAMFAPATDLVEASRPVFLGNPLWFSDYILGGWQRVNLASDKWVPLEEVGNAKRVLRKKYKRLNYYFSSGSSDVKHVLFSLVGQFWYTIWNKKRITMTSQISFGIKDLAVRKDKWDFKVKAVHVTYLYVYCFRIGIGFLGSLSQLFGICEEREWFCKETDICCGGVVINKKRRNDS